MPHITVVTLATVNHGELLVVRKSSEDILILPGGKPEPGEDDLTTLRREVLEELGCTLRAGSIRHLATFHDVAAGGADTTIEVRMYSGDLEDHPEPCAEIAELHWIDPALPPPLPCSPSLGGQILPFMAARIRDRLHPRVAARTTALELARSLHADQVDLHSVPYMQHLVAVATFLVERWPDAPDHEVDAALLHDAMEDQGATRSFLLGAGIPWEAVAIVERVTRPKDPKLTNLDWIAGLARDADLGTLKVKLSDIRHNALPERALPGSTRNQKRYAPARRMLEARYQELTGETSVPQGELLQVVEALLRLPTGPACARETAMDLLTLLARHGFTVPDGMLAVTARRVDETDPPLPGL